MQLFVEFSFITAVGSVRLEYIAVAGFKFFQHGGFIHHSGAAVVG